MKPKTFVNYFLLMIFFASHSIVIAEHPLATEYLKFHLKYLKMHVATLEFHLNPSPENENILQLTVTAKASKTANSLFPVDNIYESTFYKESFLPIFLKKQINQKNVAYIRTQRFNHEERFCVIDSSFRYEIPEKCFDYFSLIYFLRYNFRSDSTKLYLDGEFIVSQISKQNDPDTMVITVPAGNFKATRLRLRIEKISDKKRPWKTDLLTNRLTKSGSDVEIFFTADSRRLPLKIVYRNSWTRTQLVLVEFGTGGN